MEEKDIVKYAVCAISGTCFAALAYFARRAALGKPLFFSSSSKLRQRKYRDIAQMTWSKNKAKEDIQKQLLLASMDHPGLLFGWRDPTLRHSFKKLDKEYSEEYKICLTQRLHWIATINLDYRKQIIETELNTLQSGTLKSFE